MQLALWHVTVRQWKHHHIRVALTTIGVALGVAVFFAIRTTNVTLLGSLNTTIEKLAGKATLEITAGEAGFPESVLDTVRSTPGVKLAEPVIEVTATTAFPDEGKLLIMGVDTASDQQLRQYEFDKSQTQVVDTLTFIAQPDSILLSRSFADKYGLKVGDKLPLFTSSGKKEFTVRGTFKPTGVGSVFGGNIAVMDIYAAQVEFDRGHNFDRIDLMNAPDVPVDVLQQRLQARLPAGIQVERPEVRGEGLENASAVLREGMMVTSFIALLVGLFIIFNFFLISVNQRWKEIGVLRAVGAGRRNVGTMFLIEAIIMGVIGSAIGIAGGYFLARASAGVLMRATAAVYGVYSTTGATPFRWDFAAMALAAGIGSSLLAAWLPARAASRLEPALALHNIETRKTESALGWLRIGLGVLLLAGCFALIRWVPARVGSWLPVLDIAVMLVGFAALLPTMVRWAARLLRPLMDQAGGSEGALAVDAMIQTPRRSSATVGALMIGLMFVFATGGFIQSFEHVMNRWINRMINSDLFVAASQMLRSPSYHFTEALGDRINTLPGVDRAENVRFTFVNYDHDSAALMAYSMKGFLARTNDPVDEGDEKKAREELPAGTAVMVSRNFAARYGLKVGQTLTLETPSGPLSRPIVGIVDDYRSDKGTIFMDRSLYKQYWHDNSVDFVDITVKPGVDIGKVKQEIESIIAGQQHAFVYTNGEFKDWVFGLVNQFFLLNYIQLVIAVFVAVLGIVNTLIISVAERHREIGIIRAVGAFRRQIRKMVMLEAVAISLIGWILGALAGALSTYFMVHTVGMALAGYDVPFQYPWLMVWIALPSAVLLSLAAAWLPARRAVNVQVAEAIAYE
jgi:putative ABC transport system permease protein